MNQRSTRHLVALAVLACLLGGLQACSDPVAGSPPSKGDAHPDVDAPDTGAPDVADDAGPDAPKPSGFVLTGLAPDRGPTAGFTEVTLFGAGLKDTAVVYFGETPAPDWLALTDGLIVASTPPRPHGVVDVTVVHKSGKVARLDAAYVFEEPVTVGAVTPPSGHVLGGETVTITGSGFTAGARVVFGDRLAIGVEVLDGETIVATTPDTATPGPVDVRVASDLGVGRLAEGYVYFEAPRVVSVQPAVGPLAGDNRVTVLGRGFVAPLLVTLDGRECDEVQIVGPGELEVLAPAAAEPGAVDLVVSTAWGSETAERAYTYLDDVAADAPELLTVFPASGPMGGGNLVTLGVLGLSHMAEVEVRFGDRVAPLVSVDLDAHTVVVAAPTALAEGAVAVSVGSGGEPSVLDAAYTYLPSPRLHDITPIFGPAAGGTQATLSGAGFTPATEVRVGALAAQVTFVDAQTLTITTPPGTPGLANVTVFDGGQQDTLFGGFQYQAPAAIWLVDPPHGSTAGGDLVTVFGNGFLPGSQVRVGDAPATNAVVLSQGRLEAKTPPGFEGPADVLVLTSNTAAAKLAKGFTYYDPGSAPGTWGGPVARNVHVTVVDRFSGGRVAGAFVMLGHDPSTPHQGFTNADGLITFSGPELVGDQQVSATLHNHTTSSLVGFDATNVTLAVDTIPHCTDLDIPCDQPPGQSGKSDGVVDTGVKGVKKPWGRCDDQLGPPSPLCLSCDDHDECPGGRCSSLPGQGSHCTTDCTADVDCPTGFSCLPLTGVAALQCVPSPGDLQIYCDITNPGVGSIDAYPFPGVPVGPDGKFTFTSRLGDYAIFCWAGVMTPKGFRPEMLGVTRGLSATTNGQVVTMEVAIDRPLNEQVTIELDRPDLGPTALESVQARLFLDLGGEGVLEFPPMFATGRAPLSARVPSQLTGTLHDATYTLYAVVQSAQTPNAYSAILDTDLPRLRSDTAWRRGPDGWTASAPAPTEDVRGLSSAGDAVYAVGDGGLVVRSIGDGYWAHQPSGTQVDLHAVHVLAPGVGVAAGERGVATHLGDTVWTQRETGVDITLTGVWVASADEAWAVGGNHVLRYHADTWATAFTAPVKVRAVWGRVDEGATGDLWVVGAQGWVGHWDGAQWTTSTVPGQPSLNAVWGVEDAGDFRLYAVGEAGTVATWRPGEAPVVMKTPTTSTLMGVWGRGPDEVFAVGVGGRVIELEAGKWRDRSPQQHRGALLAVAGTDDVVWAMGSRELVLGPMLAIPEHISFQPGPHGSDVVSWQVRPSAEPDLQMVTFDAQTPPCTICGMLVTIPYTEWTVWADGDLTSVTLPDLVPGAGKAGLAPGLKPMTIMRAATADGMDFDDSAAGAFFGDGWRTWAVNETTVAP